MAGRMYRGDYLEPVAQPHEFVLIQGPDGIQQDGWYEVDNVEPFFGPSPHGTVILYSFSAAAPAGYSLDKQGLSAALGVGGNTGPIIPLALQVAQGFLLQVRVLARFLGLPAGLVADDLDLQAFTPRAAGKWSTINATGRWNPMYQPPLPADPAAGPAQAANAGVAAAYPQFLPWHQLNLTELFSWADSSPAFQILNNGAVAAAAGMAVGIDVFGFTYRLRPVKTKTTDVPADWYNQRIFGQDILAPPRGTWAPVTVSGGGVRSPLAA